MSEHSRDYDRYTPLLARYADLDEGDAAREALRAQLVAGFLPLTRNVARRYARRGEPVEDLEQVASLGLLNAIERFEPDRGTDFLSYALPTMMGEVRRYFRDHAWSIRTPRSVKDRFLAVSTASSALAQDLGRAPTVAELADHLDLPRDQVWEAIEARSSYQSASLDEALEGRDDELVDVLGVADPGHRHVETRTVVADLVATLPTRERRMLVLRFVHEKTQREIGTDLGISQMHVSRLLTRTLEQLRAEIERQLAAIPDRDRPRWLDPAAG